VKQGSANSKPPQTAEESAHDECGVPHNGEVQNEPMDGAALHAGNDPAERRTTLTHIATCFAAVRVLMAPPLGPRSHFSHTSAMTPQARAMTPQARLFVWPNDMEFSGERSESAATTG